MLPENINVMALTATATTCTCKQICHTLGMINPTIISRSPNRPNIFYSVENKSKSFEEAFQPVVDELK